MSLTTTVVDTALAEYIHAHNPIEHPVLSELRAHTQTLGGPAVMQIAPEQGAFMAFLVKLTGAKRILEVGTFTGYSALTCALAMPEDGLLMACDVNEEWTNIAKTFWKKAGVAHKINLHLAPALDTLEALLTDPDRHVFDMMFIDADKANYSRYFELGLKLVCPGGLILIDNVLWDGLVADPANTEGSTQAIRALNTLVASTPNHTHCIVPIGDGLTVVQVGTYA